MSDNPPAHPEGYALTGGYDVWPRAELQRAVAARVTVPVRLGDRIVGQAHLSVGDTGLRVTVDFGSPFPMMAPLSPRRSTKLALRCIVSVITPVEDG